MGLSEFGTFTLATSAVALLQVLDGGLVNTAARYFGISAGASDRDLLSRQFITILLLVMGISCVLGALVFICASDLVSVFSLGPRLHDASVFSARVVGILLPLGMLQSLQMALLQAHARFRLMTVVVVACQFAYVPAVIFLVHHSDGVQTMMRLALLQQVAILLLLMPAVGRLVTFRGAGLLAWVEIRETVGYSLQVQLFTLFGLINSQADALIIGVFLPVRDVGIYGIGANVATQLRSLPLNLGGPLVSRLAQIYGRDGDASTFREYQRLQRVWVIVAIGFSAVALGSAAFQIEIWLGSQFIDSGVVCVVLIAGNSINLLTLALTAYLQVIGKPQVEVRYGLVAASLNVGLTVAFAWLGLYAIVVATTVGQIVGSAALILLAHRSVSDDIPSFLRPAPWFAAASASIVTSGVAFGLQRASPWQGLPGLVVVSLSWGPGAFAFLSALVGPGSALVTLLDSARAKSIRPLVDIVT